MTLVFNALLKQNYPFTTVLCRVYAHCRHEPPGTAGDLPGTAPRIQQVIMALDNFFILIETQKCP
jgi:hypothetical protein